MVVMVVDYLEVIDIIMLMINDYSGGGGDNQ